MPSSRSTSPSAPALRAGTDVGSPELQTEVTRFAAQVQLSPAEPDKPRRFKGTAYGGGLIRDHWAWNAVGFDLSGLSAATPMPLLLQHGEPVGVIDEVINDGATLQIGGELFTGIEEQADRIAKKADRGMPWQMSVGIFPDEVAEVAAGSTAILNGQAIQGPAHIFRRSRVRETSFCAVGADAATHAQVFDGSRRGPLAFAVSTLQPKGVDSMTQAQQPTAEAAELEALKTENVSLKASNEALRADVDALKAQFAAGVKAARTALLKEKLGDRFSAEKVQALLLLDDAGFAAAVEFMAPASALPDGFTAEQSQQGAPAANDLSKSVLLSSAHQMFGIKAAA